MRTATDDSPAVARWRAAKAVTASAAAVLGVLVGLALTSALHDGPSTRPCALEGDAAKPAADVVHNPPLLYAPGDELALTFELVCPGEPCGDVAASLRITRGADELANLEATTSVGRVSFRVPPSAVQAPGFEYSASFALPDGTAVRYPTAGGAMAATAISEATVVDLGTATFSARDQTPGELVVSGAWGEGSDEFGINPQLSGPSSFDVDPRTGDVVVLDQVNARIVRVSPEGTSETHPVSLDSGLPDLAVGPDGSLFVLYVNAVSGAKLQQFPADGGRPLREIALASPSANGIRRVGDTLLVEEDDSYWAPVVRDGEAVPVDEQVRLAVPGIANGSHLVLRKHLLDHGNEVRVADSVDGRVRAWRLTGTTSLGAVLAATPLDDGRVLVVQSQFDDHGSQSSIVTLGDQTARVVVAPHALYAGMYDPSEFRVDGEDVYQVRSTKSGYAIYRYQV